MRAIHVRWLEAFASQVSFDVPPQRRINAAVRYELTTDEARPWAHQWADVRVGYALIGLLVDPARSDVAAAFEGNAWSERASDTSIGVTWNTWDGHPAPRGRPHSRRYLAVASPVKGWDEVIGIPVFLGVVVHPDANKEWRRIARRAAHVCGLPYLGSTTGNRVKSIMRRLRQESMKGGGRR